jgi:hypothetical protein
MASPLNPEAVPAITYEYLFYLSSSERALATRLMEGSGTTIVVLYPRYHGSPILAQKFGYNRFFLAANSWRTKYLIPDIGSTNSG